MMLTDDEITAMRATVESAFPETCVYYAPVYTSDGAGRNTLAYSTPGGTVACRVRPVKAAGLENMVRAKTEGAIYAYIISVPHDTPLALDYHIVYQGTSYELAWLDEDMSWNLQRQAYLRRIE